MDIYKADVFTWYEQRREKFVLLGDIVDINDPTIQEKISEKVNAKKKVHATSIDLQSTYIKVAYQQRARNFEFSGFNLVAETREQAVEKAYTAYVMYKVFNSHKAVDVQISVRGDVESKVSKYMKNAKRHVDYGNYWDSACKRVKGMLTSKEASNPYGFGYSNNKDENVAYAVRHFISNGIVKPDPQINAEEFAIQEALGHLGAVMQTTPLKIDEDMLNFLDVRHEDIHPSVWKALNAYHKTREIKAALLPLEKVSA